MFVPPPPMDGSKHANHVPKHQIVLDMIVLHLFFGLFLHFVPAIRIGGWVNVWTSGGVQNPYNHNPYLMVKLLVNILTGSVFELLLCLSNTCVHSSGFPPFLIN